MNWNYWLPWREYPQEDTNDSTLEAEVIDPCDHEFEEEAELLDSLRFGAAKFESGYIVIPRFEVVNEFCKKCGEPALDGEVHPYESHEYEFLTPYDGQYQRIAHKVAIEPDFRVDPDVDLSEAISEPVQADADIVVDEDGEAEVVEEDDGNGRILVNKNEAGAD